jgi:hypothetical protein
VLKLIKDSEDEKLKAYFNDKLKYEDLFSGTWTNLFTAHLGADLVLGTTCGLPGSSSPSRLFRFWPYDKVH